MRDDVTPASPELEIKRIAAPAGNSDAPGEAALPTLIFLHEGLGSVSGWQRFPEQLCAQTGLPGLVYSRQGYGRSAPLNEPFSVNFLHQAAHTELNQVLATARISDAILIGHSDGASIALIRASEPAPQQASPGTARIHGVVAIAPHLFVEPICIEAIASVSRRIEENPARLAFLEAHHNDAATVFAAWSGAWLDPAFHALDLSAEVAAIECPVLAVQGDQDQYGTLEQINSLARLARHGTKLVIEGCRHAPHQEATSALLAACEAFVRSCRPGR